MHWELATIAANGWFTSWAIEAESSARLAALARTALSLLRGTPQRFLRRAPGRRCRWADGLYHWTMRTVRGRAAARRGRRPSDRRRPHGACGTSWSRARPVARERRAVSDAGSAHRRDGRGSVTGGRQAAHAGLVQFATSRPKKSIRRLLTKTRLAFRRQAPDMDREPCSTSCESSRSRSRKASCARTSSSMSRETPYHCTIAPFSSRRGSTRHSAQR